MYHTSNDQVAPGAGACPYSAGVVAQITSGTAFDKHGRPFRRRNFLPGAVVLAVLAVVALVAWLIAFNQPVDVEKAAACNPPPAATNPNQPTLGSPVSAATMTEVVPAKLADTKIRVLNASGQGGQAAEVSGALRDLGFAQPAAANVVRHRCTVVFGRFNLRARALNPTGWLRATPSSTSKAVTTLRTSHRQSPSRHNGILAAGQTPRAQNDCSRWAHPSPRLRSHQPTDHAVPTALGHRRFQ